MSRAVRRTTLSPNSEPLAPASRSRAHSRLALAAVVLTAAAIVAAVYWPVLSVQARSFDDNHFVADNPLVTRPGAASALRFFTEVLEPSTVGGYYMPLTMTSLMLDYALGGRPDDLRVFHATNLALHALGTVLVLLLLRSLFGALLPATLAALLFGLHPLTVEPVAWVAERKTLLATCFGFASILAYAESCRHGRHFWLTASLALYVLALLSKPTVTLLPVLLVLLDGWPLGRFNRHTLVEKWPYVLVSVVFGLITIVSHERSVGLSLPGRGSPLDWPFQASYLLAFYLGKVVWPTRLSSVYSEPFPFSPSNPLVLVSSIAVCALTVLLVLLWRNSRGPLTGWLFFCIAIAPTLGLIHYTWVLASDKYVYWPALGLVLAVGAGLAAAAMRLEAWRSRGSAFLLAPVVIVLGLEAVGVRAQLRNWKDTLTLFLHMEAISPNSPAIHNNLGSLYVASGDHEQAVRHFRAALRVMPDLGETHLNLGIALRNQGKLDESIVHLRKAAEIGSTFPPAALQLGETLLRAGQLEGAESEFRRALRLLPDYPEARARLGALLARQGRTSEAIVEFRAGIAAAPGDAALLFGLGLALQQQGDAAQAVSHLRQATTASPGWGDPYNALAWLLATSPDAAIRNPAEALKLAGRAVELSGGRSANALDTQAAAQAAVGEFDQAIRTAGLASDLASKANDGPLARAIGERSKLYQRHTAYTEAPTGSPARRAGEAP